MIADQVATNCRKANITPRQVAMLDFALKVFDNAVAIDEFDFETLHGHGFNDEDIWDIAAISGLYSLSNRMANFARIRPNDEFYLMGRVPRERS